MTTANSTHSHPPGPFPDPQPFPSPSMNNFAAYCPPGSSQSSEGYRGSPTGSNVSLPSLNLPPIRMMDGRPSSQPQQTQPGTPPPQSTFMPMNSSLPLPMNQFYAPTQTLPPPQHMHITSDPNQQSRYPVPPPADGRLMSGGKHKKEIKRRTKTGCLTCRKRRIKCDEAHPVCRNCTKSKRDCAGYDPIFKSQPGPTAIQPAPSSAGSSQATPSHPSVSQSYAPVNHPFSNAITASGAPRPASIEPYDYGAPVDPALEAALNSHNHSTPNMSSTTFDGMQGAPQEALYPPLKGTKIEPYLLAGGVPPPYVPSTPLSKERLDEVMTVYKTIYAIAIDKFIETEWFRSHSEPYLLASPRLLDLFAALVDRYNITPENTPQYYAAYASTQSLEAHIVWALMLLCRDAARDPQPPETNGSSRSNGTPQSATPPPDFDESLKLAVSRVRILETLIINEHLDSPLPSSPKLPPTDQGTGSHFQPNGTRLTSSPALPSQLIHRSQTFWHLLDRLLTLHDDEASNAKSLDDTLSSLRKHLDMKENRDVLYSVAVARVHGARMAEWWPDRIEQAPQTLQAGGKEGESPAGTLGMAKKFLEGEQVTGTNQVVQRVAGWVVRGWTLQAAVRR